MRAAQRWRHCNYSHLAGIQLLLIADVASARSNFPIAIRRIARRKNRQHHGAFAPGGSGGGLTAHQTMRWSRPYPVDILKAFSFSFLGF